MQVLQLHERLKYQQEQRIQHEHLQAEQGQALCLLHEGWQQLYNLDPIPTLELVQQEMTLM